MLARTASPFRPTWSMAMMTVWLLATGARTEDLARSPRSPYGLFSVEEAGHRLEMWIVPDSSPGGETANAVFRCIVNGKALRPVPGQVQFPQENRLRAIVPPGTPCSGILLADAKADDGSVKNRGGTAKLNRLCRFSASSKNPLLGSFTNLYLHEEGDLVGQELGVVEAVGGVVAIYYDSEGSESLEIGPAEVKRNALASNTKAGLLRTRRTEKGMVSTIDRRPLEPMRVGEYWVRGCETK